MAFRLRSKNAIRTVWCTDSSYTFSKSMGDGEAGGNEDGNFQDPRNRATSRGRFQFDQTHSAAFHFVYDLPFGKGLHGGRGTSSRDGR